MRSSKFKCVVWSKDKLRRKMQNWKRNVIIGLVVCFLMALFACIGSLRLRNDLIKGRIALSEIRLYKGGSTYVIDQIEGLGRNKYFFSFKEE